MASGARRQPNPPLDATPLATSRTIRPCHRSKPSFAASLPAYSFWLLLGSLPKPCLSARTLLRNSNGILPICMPTQPHGKRIGSDFSKNCPQCQHIGANWVKAERACCRPLKASKRSRPSSPISMSTLGSRIMKTPASPRMPRASRRLRGFIPSTSKPCPTSHPNCWPSPTRR